jgi:7,8-dihydroneopterin aldolase/epimerase/oxygenase
MASITIHLRRLQFFAPHGMFEEEQLAGNEFEVDLSLEIDAPNDRLASLEESINYATVFELVKRVFEKPEALLENLAMTIASDVKLHFPVLKKISVQITKLHPPIISFTGSVGVTFEKSYKD